MYLDSSFIRLLGNQETVAAMKNYSTSVDARDDATCSFAGNPKKYPDSFMDYSCMRKV